MAIETLFLDGFDGYTSSSAGPTLSGRWMAYSSTSAISNTSGREGGGCFVKSITTLSNHMYHELKEPMRTVVVGFAFYSYDMKPGSSNNAGILALRSGPRGPSRTKQISLILGSDGILKVMRGDYNGTQLAKGTTVLTDSSWHYIELRVYIDDAAGEVHLKLDGVDEIAETTGLDTQEDATYDDVAEIALITPDHTYNASGEYSKFDDFYVRGDTVNTSGGFLGDVRIVVLSPNANGANRDFTLSAGTDDFAVLDELYAKGDDYAYSATAADKITCGFESIPAGADIKGVTLSLSTDISSAGNREIKPVCKSGATTDVGTAQRAVVSKYIRAVNYPLDPNTAAAWTEANLNAAEFGVEVV